MSESVLFVTQHYAPEEIGSGPYCTDIAQFLCRHGRHVTVLTGQPHYPDPDRFAGSDAAGPAKASPGIEVRRLRHWLPRQRSVSKRIIGEFLFMLSGLWVLLSRQVHRHDLVLSLCPSIFAVALAVAATARKGRHVVLVHDIQSGLAGGLGMVRSRRLLQLMRWCERSLLNRADLLLVLSEEMRLQLRQIGVRVPIEVFPIWVDTSAIQPQPPKSRAAPVLLYSGNLGRKQGLDQVLALSEQLQALRPEIPVVIRGAGGERAALATAASRSGLTNITFEDLVPRAQLNDGLAEGDIHLVPQRADGADFAVPSKIYSILAAGRCLVATALPGSALWRLQAETGAFLCVPPNDPSAFAAAVLRLADDPELRREMGQRGRRHIEEHHARDRLLARLDEFLVTLSRDGELPARSTGLVILEPDKNGHAREWLRHIISQAGNQPQLEVLWLALPGDLCAILQDAIPPRDSGRIRLLPLTEAEERACTHRRLVVSGFARWWVMRRYLRRTGAAAGHFLALDHLSLPLALGLGGFGRRLGGILFRPSVHYPSFGPCRRSVAERLRDLRKSALYRLMLLNRALSVVLTLDPFFPDYAAEAYRGGYKVTALPDPAFVPPDSPGGIAGLEFPPGRKRLLLFGVLTERKGILRLLEALTLLPPAAAAQIALIIAGSISPAIRPSVLLAVTRLRQTQPQLWLHMEDRWLEDNEIAGLVRTSDVILAPYQRFVGSSGVLLWAARAGIPVLTQDYGLIARLVRDNRLGITADVTDPRILAAAIARIAEEGVGDEFDPSSAAAFVAARSPETFATTILAAARAA